MDTPFSNLTRERSQLDLVKAGTTAREGRRARVSISSGLLMVLSMYSRSNAKPMPPTKPTKKDKTILRDFAGREGYVGTMAGSTTRILDERKPAEMPASFNLGSRPS